MDWKKLQNIDRRIIYVLLILVTATPMIRPLAIPLTVNPAAQKFYDIMDAIPAGEKVLFSLDYAPSGAPDVHPQAMAVMKHMMQKGVGVVFISFWEAGPMFAEQLIRAYEAEGLEYGVHFANLGYIPGGESAIKRFGEDVAGQVTRDFRNNNVSSLPIMQGVKDTRDFALVIGFSAGNPGIQEWVRQVQGPLGITLLAGAVTVSVPQYMPYVNAGQVQAMLAGLRGAAEYETVMGSPGPAVAKMDAQSLGHLVIIAFIIIGNLAYFLDKKKN
ncbi:MAG: hypothetical protein GX033_06095 [Firmicutes bacterium]|nr:hypothetical protein [Bacillota bacterium]